MLHSASNVLEPMLHPEFIKLLDINTPDSIFFGGGGSSLISERIISLNLYHMCDLCLLQVFFKWGSYSEYMCIVCLLLVDFLMSNMSEPPSYVYMVTLGFPVIHVLFVCSKF